MTTPLRSLLENKTAAALQANAAMSVNSILDIPTVAAATKGYTLPLVCKRTGITVGSLNVGTIAGHMPMIGQWKETMVLHPLFSLAPTALLHYAKNTWSRYCAFSIEEGSDEGLVNKQEQALQVAALAMMYNLTEVRQDITWLPDFKEVSNNWASLIAISYWKNYLDSERFRFPGIHISRMESAFSLRDYIQTCWAVKKGYETRVNERVEAEKLKAADAAMIALRDEMAGARPTSTRQLWRWFVINMPARYKKDLETWMSDIFFAKGGELEQYSVKDIDIFEEYFLCECPTGSSISHAFSEILAAKRNYLQQKHEAFEIIMPTIIVQEKAAGTIAVAEPQRSEYPTKVGYLVAMAKWRLAHTDLLKNIQAAQDRNSQATVRPVNKVTLVIREDEPNEDVDDSDEVLDALRAGKDVNAGEDE